MMGIQNLCTLFGPTLMKLSPKEQQIDDMAKEIKESMQQAQALFYIMKLHEENRLLVDPEQKEQLNQFAQSQNKSLSQVDYAEESKRAVNGQTSQHQEKNQNIDLGNTPGKTPIKRYEQLSLKDERSSRANMQTAL